MFEVRQLGLDVDALPLEIIEAANARFTLHCDA
jgi:hypothetical protein